jgi:hypothetical protein
VAAAQAAVAAFLLHQAPPGADAEEFVDRERCRSQVRGMLLGGHAAAFHGLIFFNSLAIRSRSMAVS